MLVTNNDKVGKWFMYKVNGQVKRCQIPGMTTVELPDLISSVQIIKNQYDLKVAHINSFLNRGLDGDFTSVPTSDSIPTSSNATVQAWIDKIELDGYSYPSQSKVNVYTAAFDYADTQGLTSQFQLLCCFNVNDRNVMKIPFIHSGGALKRLEEVVYQGNGLIFYANEGFTTSNGTDMGYFRTNWVESVDASTPMLNNTSLGGYVLDQSVNTSGNIGGTISSDYTNSTQLIPKYSPASTTAVLIQSLGNILAPTTNFVGDGHIYSTLYNDTLTLYIDGVSVGNISSPPDGVSDLQDCIGTIEVDGDVTDTNTEYKLAIYYRTVGNINTTHLNTFINMLML